MVSPPALTYTYKIHHLDSTSPTFPFLVGKYASLSLRALTTDPSSFGVAYLTEASWTFQDYTRRLLRPHVQVYICSAHPASATAETQTIDRGEWVGMVTQLGPTPREDYWVEASGAQKPMDDFREAKFHQTAMWIDPRHRGKGVAKMLLRAAEEHALEMARAEGRTQVRLRAFVGPDNVKSRGLYVAAGFVDDGRCTIAEAMRGNGNAELPYNGKMDWPDEVMNARVGRILTKVCQI